MNPDVRSAILAAGLAFCLLFGAASLVAIFEAVSFFGVLLGVLSFAIIAMIGLGLLGAMRNPPGR